MKAAGTEPPVQPRGPFLHSGETEGPCAANPPPKGEDDPLRRGGRPTRYLAMFCVYVVAMGAEG